ncbi:YgjP-like metallopeptidase domain-containing protein [Olegusella massiliensis]|uniref:YgjP-like metallopeptidase domain-containing protein n=1 Tax=Olegusella massiliensis TaxID=1776381 RepID=UPI0008389928|nr:YgjP-like metallopeptidase domain-containing protein [Olegusella massiliensis]
MQIVVAGIPIDVQKKNIKNMHLQVKPPDGHVVISAPSSIDDKAIEAYARTNLSWIKRSIKKFEDQPRSSKRQYVSGETIYIWGSQYFIKFVHDSQKNNFVIEGNQVILRMNKNSTVKQRDNYVKEQYRAMLKKEIEHYLPKWESITGLHCESWQTKYMVTRWGTCNTEKKKLWFNLQLAQKPLECLEFVILHELIHLIERTHNATFISYMDLYMPNWREVRKELNDRKLDYYDAQNESPLKRLIDTSRFDEVKDAALQHLESEKLLASGETCSDVEIENVIHIEERQEGFIDFDVVVSCDIEKKSTRRSKAQFYEKWLNVHCRVSLGIELSGFEIVSVEPCETKEENENSRFSGELVPIISREDLEDEATRFLEKYYKKALRESVPVPIREIAGNAMELRIVEDEKLSDDLSVFGLIVFEDGNIANSDRKIIIRNAKRGTMYVDPRVFYERTLGTLNSTIAHECFHWHRHQPYHALMKMIGAKDGLGKNIQCAIGANRGNSDRWKAVDWMEWQANEIAPKILMPYKTAKRYCKKLIEENVAHLDGQKRMAALEQVVDDVAAYYGVSRQAAKIRMRELGLPEVDGVYSYLDGQYIRHFQYSIDALKDGETFSISMTDLFKAYCFDARFRELIDSGYVVYADGHLCYNHSDYITVDGNGIARMTDYGLAHVDECCFVFERGYTFDSKYQGVRNYQQFLTKTNFQLSSAELSYDENNPHNKALNAVMENAAKYAARQRQLPGSFAESLVQLMKEQKITVEALSDRSLLGVKTIQRLRNDEEYPTSKQTVLALCVGLRLSSADAEDLFSKTDFKLNTKQIEDYIYRCVLGACANNSIYVINEMLKRHKVPLLGSSPEE